MDLKDVKFGDEMKDEFLLDKSCAFVNHGSYGPTPKRVVEQKVKFIYEQEAQPDLWFRFNLEKYYDASLTAAAEFLGVKKSNLVLVDNVTTGVNTVVKCLKFEPGDQILIHTHTYNAVKNIADEQEDFIKGVKVVTAEIPLPIKSEDDLVDVFRKALDENPKIKLAVLDHITSPSAIIFPVEKLSKLCRERGVLTLIDGAHAPGQIKLNVAEVGADFYSANFHKWCYVPRSCGFIWFSDDFHGQLRPLVTSHGYKHSLDDQFNNLGTRDISSYFCIPHALKFYKEIGGLEAIQAHGRELTKFAAKILCEALGTEELDIPDSMRAPCMTTIRLPLKKPAKLAEADVMTKDIFKFHKAQVTISVYNDQFRIRPTINIYNSKNDLMQLKDAVVTYLNENYADYIEYKLPCN
uniref:hercynylcysteine sulfoxide lyase-like isoform X1 n=1 Tax=Styela clava TaxID=7725 RepID=UPI00193AA8F2|nr:hercynylcysteine sulfoxide lyase-like isoform X1 [Styela clava]